jgi:hypothetical protein
MVKLFLLVIFLIKYAFSNENVDLTYKNNYYILLSSSKFYFNQRHSTNVMIFYQYLKKRGITDDRVSQSILNMKKYV